MLTLGILLTLGACGQEQAPEPPAEAAAAPETFVPVTAEETGGTAAEPVATTSAGKVRGFVKDDVYVFKGVRYGADTATTRFAAPEPPAAWDGIADATEFGASAVQVPYPTGTAGGLFESWGTDPAPPMSEDCLFLNVWTPALADNGKRPVMVWFHGGGLTRGSGSSNAYNGVRLANRGDVVVVTVNHRLNVFGYTYLGDYGERYADSGNAGVLDMVLALEWVRDNITEFGGDPTNVTIFGESGGGFKVTTLMAMEAAEGLFKRGIVQSGPAPELMERETAIAGGAALLQQLGLTTETIDEILALPAEDLLAAFGAVNAAGTPVGVRAVIDGRNFHRHPFVPDANPRVADIPMMIGTTRTENSLFIGASNPASFDLTWEQLPAAMEASARGGNLNVDVNELIAEYRRIRPEYSPADVLFTATTDAGFLNRSHLQADRKSELGGAPTYFYMLNWDTPVDGGKWRSPHALEIGMVFDNVALSESMSGIGEEQQHIADMMSESWLAFARTGNPNHPGIPEWPVYDTESRMVMMFDLEPRAAADPHGEQRKLFLSEGP
jgi:para-nitrobenzyl esterase